MKYGVISYSSVNIGDEIQSVAALRFLPQVDAYVARERIDKFKSDEPTKLIMNAWWMHKPNHFPPSDAIDPLLISMHIQYRIRDRFMTKKTKEYLVKHGPVGCRDLSTKEYLDEHGVAAYFSGCLTLTLEPNPAIKKQDYIVTVDVPEEVVEEIRKRTKRPVYDVSRMLIPIFSPQERFKVAKIMLNLYQGAHCVVSPRLHVALPCLALKTPLMFLDIEKQRTKRFDGFLEMLNKVTPDDFLKNKDAYDFDNPPKNPEKHLEMKAELIKRCEAFTGYNNPNSVIDVVDALPELVRLLHTNKKNRRRMLYFVGMSNLVKAFFRRLLGKQKHDLID